MWIITLISGIQARQKVLNVFTGFHSHSLHNHTTQQQGFTSIKSFLLQWWEQWLIAVRRSWHDYSVCKRLPENTASFVCPFMYHCTFANVSPCWHYLTGASEANWRNSSCNTFWCRATCHAIISHGCSTGMRSGDFEGHSIRTTNSFSYSLNHPASLFFSFCACFCFTLISSDFCLEFVAVSLQRTMHPLK